MKTMTSREFNQHIGQAQRAAQTAPVFVTRRGKPAFVLLNYEDYRQLAGGLSAYDVLCGMDAPDVGDMMLPIPPRRAAQRPQVDFSE